jgi:hypothetical protein
MQDEASGACTHDSLLDINNQQSTRRCTVMVILMWHRHVVTTHAAAYMLLLGFASQLLTHFLACVLFQHAPSDHTGTFYVNDRLKGLLFEELQQV